MFRTGVFFMLILLASSVQAQDLTGHWTGYWHSGFNNHQGRLQARFQQTHPQILEAQFRGTFAKIIPFRYRARLQVVHQEPGLTVLSGSRKLPFSGEFRYYAQITEGEFLGTFESRRNHGTWVMNRPVYGQW